VSLRIATFQNNGTISIKGAPPYPSLQNMSLFAEKDRIWLSIQRAEEVIAHYNSQINNIERKIAVYIGTHGKSEDQLIQEGDCRLMKLEEDLRKEKYELSRKEEELSKWTEYLQQKDKELTAQSLLSREGSQVEVGENIKETLTATGSSSTGNGIYFNF
jgi:hypothetical protein